MKEVLVYQTSDGKMFASKAIAKAYEDDLTSGKEWDIEFHYEGRYRTTVYAKTRERAIEIAREEADEVGIDYEEVNVYAGEV